MSTSEHANSSGRLSGALWVIPGLLLLAVAWAVLGAITAKTVKSGDLPVARTTGYPRMVRVSGAKQIEIPAKPMRIVAANSGAADILSGLIEPSRFAAVPGQVDEFAAARTYWAAHKEIPRFDQYQAMTILAVKPDLVVSSSFQDAATAAAIAGRGIPILNLDQFETLDGIRNAIRVLGLAADEVDHATNMIADFDARLQQVEKASFPTRLRVLGYSNFGSGYAVGVGGSQDEILHCAGGINCAAEMNMKGPSPMTFEQLIKLDPDVIVVSGDAGLENMQVKLLMNEPVLGNLRAVKMKRFAVVPGRLFDALSQHVVEAVEILGRQLREFPKEKPTP